MQFKTLADYKTYCDQERVAGKELPTLMLDNDTTDVYLEEEEFGSAVFSMHPEQLLEEALTLLGIPHDHV